LILRVPDILIHSLCVPAATPATQGPPAIHGRPVCLVLVCWTGEHEAGERAIAPLRRFGRPLFDGIAARPYIALQSSLDAGHATVRFKFIDQPVRNRHFWLVIDHGDVELCVNDPGFEPDLTVRAETEAFVRWFMGQLNWADVLRAGTVSLEGPRALSRAFPSWTDRSRYAPLEAELATPPPPPHRRSRLILLLAMSDLLPPPHLVLDALLPTYCSRECPPASAVL
jgi:hypothetical protein